MARKQSQKEILRALNTLACAHVNIGHTDAQFAVSTYDAGPDAPVIFVATGPAAEYMKKAALDFSAIDEFVKVGTIQSGVRSGPDAELAELRKIAGLKT